jgi:hypothetical protein
MSEEEQLTAWGRWLVQQPRGTKNRAHRATGLALTTLDHARRNLVTNEVAELLAAFSKGAFKASEMRRPKRKLAPIPSRKAVA